TEPQLVRLSEWPTQDGDEATSLLAHQLDPVLAGRDRDERAVRTDRGGRRRPDRSRREGEGPAETPIAPGVQGDRRPVIGGTENRAPVRAEGNPLNCSRVSGKRFAEPLGERPQPNGAVSRAGCKP